MPPGSGGGGIGSVITYSPPSGVIDPAPPGFSASVGRIQITLAGNTSFKGFPTMADGQQVFLEVVSGNFTLTLLHLDGATALKQIRASADFSYALGDTAQMYGDLGANVWVLVP